MTPFSPLAQMILRSNFAKISNFKGRANFHILITYSMSYKSYLNTIIKLLLRYKAFITKAFDLEVQKKKVDLDVS